MWYLKSEFVCNKHETLAQLALLLYKNTPLKCITQRTKNNKVLYSLIRWCLFVFLASGEFEAKHVDSPVELGEGHGGNGVNS